MQEKRLFTLLALPSVGNFHSCCYFFNLWCTDKQSIWARLYVWGRDGGDLNKYYYFFGGGIKGKVMGVVYGLKSLKWHSFLNIWLDTLCIINIGNSKIFRRSLVLSIQGFLGGGWFCAFAFNANVSLLSSRAKPYEEK